MKASARQNPIYGARSRFVGNYCEAKGWDRDHLSIEQMHEIRVQPKWIDPFDERNPASTRAPKMTLREALKLAAANRAKKKRKVA